MINPIRQDIMINFLCLIIGLVHVLDNENPKESNDSIAYIQALDTIVEYVNSQETE
jgi:hypothetical protein